MIVNTELAEMIQEIVRIRLATMVADVTDELQNSNEIEPGMLIPMDDDDVEMDWADHFAMALDTAIGNAVKQSARDSW